MLGDPLLECLATAGASSLLPLAFGPEELSKEQCHVGLRAGTNSLKSRRQDRRLEQFLLLEGAWLAQN